MTLSGPGFRPRLVLVGLLLGAGCVAMEYYGARDLDSTADMPGAWFIAGCFVVVALICDVVVWQIDKRKSGR